MNYMCMRAAYVCNIVQLSGQSGVIWIKAVHVPLLMVLSCVHVIFFLTCNCHSCLFVCVFQG